MDIVLVVLGVLIGLAVLGLVFWVAFRPRKAGTRSWIAPPSGREHDPTEHWPGPPPYE